MAKIDTSGWQKFIIGDLFEKLDTSFLGKGVKKRAVQDHPDEMYCVPLTYAKRYNNGIMYWGKVGDFKTHKNALSVIYNGAVSAGRVYAQSEETGVLAESYMIKLKDKDVSFNTYLFLQRVIEICIYSRFSYSDLAVWPSVQKEAIWLPVDTSGEPDWVYMDSYMSQVMSDVEASLDALGQADSGVTAVDVNEWHKFVIGDLFEKLKLGIKKQDFNKATDVSEEKTDEYNIPIVNAKHGNNGIMFYGRREDFETAEMTIDIVQNGAVATGDVYAQPQETGVLWDAYLIKPKHEINSEYTLMFLAVAIEKSIKGRFSYDDKCVWAKASKICVELPVDSSGNPDWEYMDSYMKRIMVESEVHLESLRITLGI